MEPVINIDTREAFNYYHFWISYFIKLEQFNTCLKNLSLELINSNKCLNYQNNYIKNNNSKEAESSLSHDSDEAFSSNELDNSNSEFKVPTNEKDIAWLEFKERQKKFNKYVKQRFIEEFGPIENLTYKMIKRSAFDLMTQIKEEARDKFLPQDLTETEFKNYWKSALNTIRQTRYRYRSKQNKNRSKFWIN